MIVQPIDRHMLAALRRFALAAEALLLRNHRTMFRRRTMGISLLGKPASGAALENQATQPRPHRRALLYGAGGACVAGTTPLREIEGE